MSSRKTKRVSDDEDGLEEQLLSLASKKKDTSKKRRRDSDSDEPKKRPAKKRAPASRRKRKSESSDDSDDSDDSSDDDSSSSGSSSSSSEGSDVDSGAEFKDEWGDDMMGDAEDRRRLAAMPEREREQVILDRYEQRDRMKERFELRKQMKLNRRKDAGKKDKKTSKGKKPTKKAKKALADKSKASSKASKGKGEKRGSSRRKDDSSAEESESASTSSGGDDGDYGGSGRRTTRSSKRIAETPEGESGRSGQRDRRQSVEQMRAKRSADADRNEELFGRSGGEDSDADSDGGKDRRVSISRSRAPLSAGSRERSSYKPSYGDDKESKESQRHSATLEEMARVQIRRAHLKSWIHFEYFENFVVGFFVRVHIGVDKTRLDPLTKMPARVYRLAEIVSVQKGVSYEFDGTRADKHLLLRVGKEGGEKRFPARMVSNDRLTESEFGNFKRLEEEFGIDLPTSGSASQLAKRLMEQLAYQPTDEEFNSMLESKRRLNPTNATVLEGDRIRREIQIKEQTGETDGIDELKSRLEDVDQQLKRMHDQRDEGLSVIDKINERNRRKNIVDVHKAFVEAWKRDTGSGHASDGHESAADPFERRKCRPLLVRHTNSPSKNKRPEEEAAAGVHDAASDDAGGSAMHTATGTPALSSQVASPAPASVAGVNAAASTRKVDDPYKAHDFDFDIDIDVGSDRKDGPAGGGASLGGKKRPEDLLGAKRALSIVDYKRKRGLI
eukprot:Opistho-2@23132